MVVGRRAARTFLGRLARKQPSPLARGDERIWAGTVLYVLGQLNFLFDPRSTPHMTGDELAAAVEVPQRDVIPAGCRSASRRPPWTTATRPGRSGP